MTTKEIYQTRYLNSLKFVRLESWLIFIPSLLGFIMSIRLIYKEVGYGWLDLIIFGWLLFVSGKGITSSMTKEFIEKRRME